MHSTDKNLCYTLALTAFLLLHYCASGRQFHPLANASVAGVAIICMETNARSREPKSDSRGPPRQCVAGNPAVHLVISMMGHNPLKWREFAISKSHHDMQMAQCMVRKQAMPASCSMSQRSYMLDTFPAYIELLRTE